MEIIATVIAGLVLAGAAVTGVVVTQADKPAGTDVAKTISVDESGNIVYDTGQ